MLHTNATSLLINWSAKEPDSHTVALSVDISRTYDEGTFFTILFFFFFFFFFQNEAWTILCKQLYS
jgi:hypothetical protein